MRRGEDPEDGEGGLAELKGGERVGGGDPGPVRLVRGGQGAGVVRVLVQVLAFEDGGAGAAKG